MLTPERFENGGIKNIAVVNNSLWALTEMFYNCKEELLKVVQPLMLQAIAILNQNNLMKPIADMACGLIGRLSIICPEKLAYYLNDYLKKWCFIGRGLNAKS